ncbi:MAG: hypothetical protein GOMPHAMPRED_006190 [Gomphillus americanus]|uniref:Very-long-chain 3-oxoacyl-CoA reductase n=1 Tax=Gomphillus americanus TaxID=1940652 RepID=A0A8H3EL60_9LECA|nr:MAG: hypothetical protein GOMPHAMPRED_006190 [Gomphillus americanus]
MAGIHTIQYCDSSSHDSVFAALSSPALRPVVLGFATIGVTFLSYKLFSFVRLLLSLFVLPGKSLKSFAANSNPRNSWAVVTGATDGIGLEFVNQLANTGYNIVVVSRTKSKLDLVAENLAAKHKGISTRSLAIDFSNAGQSDYAALSSLIQGLDIAVLINNVGRSHDIPVPFAQTPQDEVDAIVNINVHATLRVTSIVLPGMIQRKNGLVLTMGSFGGLIPTPLLATYSGSKAFLQQWSSALGSELSSHGITVELVQSYLVTSAMSKIRKASASIPTPKAFVTATLKSIGRSGGAQDFAHTSTPFWSHAVMQWFVGTFAGFTSSFVVSRNKVMHEAIRRRALKKQAGKKDR